MVGAGELDVHINLLLLAQGIGYGFSLFGRNVLVQSAPDEQGRRLQI
jgi:hypothetical protein